MRTLKAIAIVIGVPLVMWTAAAALVVWYMS